ncbi:PB1 domain-containing protein [Schizophyllum amplum]|uniref:PB1 domain-containing protein n=1 Tax=Schizophyllum amplum TaxID=97359 RepID=A0A550CWL1_9AGAR|nr:PB1 domain-containing protein [Auriculariopsis ampla]
MSLKAELETWAAALAAYDKEDFEQSLELFGRIADSSKILTNIGLIYATLGEHEAAVQHFIEATSLDKYLAVAYFQCGVSNFLMNRYDLAYTDFEEAFLRLRDNQDINYEQLGLKFKLYSAEVLFNKGLSMIYMGRVQEGLAIMQDARKDKATDEHNVIDDAIADQGQGYTVFSIPVGVLYRPSEKKLKNAATKDYMGKARLVAASDANDITTEFTGAYRLKKGVSPGGIFINREEPVNLGRNATVPAPVNPEFEANRALTRTATEVVVPRNPATPAPPLTRANTMLNVARPSPNAAIGGPGQGPGPMPVRGLSIRKADSPTSRSQGGPPPPLPPTKVSPTARQTVATEDIYDGYLDAYTDPTPSRAQSPPTGPERVAAWARTNAAPGYPPATRSAPRSNYAPSSFGGASVRRRTTRRTVARAPSTRMTSAYDGFEEEEGYGSGGEYEDGPFELVKIRVKLYYGSDVRGMAIEPAMPFEEFMDRVTSKFGQSVNTMRLKFKDEDGSKVTLQDDSDYDLAIETARESAKGKPEGKLEIWCTDA